MTVCVTTAPDRVTTSTLTTRDRVDAGVDELVVMGTATTGVEVVETVYVVYVLVGLVVLLVEDDDEMVLVDDYTDVSTILMAVVFT